MAEFLELIGRVAEAKYKHDKESPLSEKILKILDIIFTLVDEKAKIPVPVEAGDGSQSDADY